jgi:hypothetical protein
MVPLGDYVYSKRKPSGRLLPVRVEVYPLQVSVEHPDWPEQGQRDKQWLTPSAAAALVDEPDLSDLLARFNPPGSTPARLVVNG